MSNSTDNQSVMLTRLWDTIPQVAYAMARGKDGLADSANDMFRLVMTDESVSPEGIAAKFYDEVRTQANAIAPARPWSWYAQSRAWSAESPRSR